MSAFESLDLSCLHFINQVWTAPFLDTFFLTITNLHKQDWVRFGVIPMMVGVAVYLKGRGALKAALVMIVTIGACDFVNHRVIKELFNRQRPFVEYPDQVTLRLSYRPGGKSFPSNHATNMAAAARFISAYVPPLGVVIVTYSILVAYSRPYLGVHFPSDVVIGWLWGWLIASLVIIALRRYRPDWGPEK